MGDKITAFNQIKSISINNNCIDFNSPRIMGILNLTPDSFYDGGAYSNISDIINKTKDMLFNGAHIIDIGAVSTRPGSSQINADEERKRLIPTLKLLVNEFPDTLFSVDTYRATIAEESINTGAHMINDISGGTMDNNMYNVIAKYNVPYVLMHIQGSPETMQQSPITTNILNTVRSYFVDRVTKLKDLGASNIILDPGFGFGKSLESNYQLLKYMEEIRIDSLPILAGISRKSMINKVLNILPGDALTGTITLNTIALQNGANILRVHDVKEAKETIDIVEFMKNNTT